MRNLFIILIKRIMIIEKIIIYIIDNNIMDIIDNNINVIINKCCLMFGLIYFYIVVRL